MVALMFMQARWKKPNWNWCDLKVGWTLRYMSYLQLNSRNMLSLVMNLGDQNMAFESVTKKYHPCHKISYSYPRVLPLPSWTSISSVELPFCFLHPPAYPGSSYWASTGHNPQKGPWTGHGKGRNLLHQLCHQNIVTWNCVQAETPFTAFGGANLTPISSNLHWLQFFWMGNVQSLWLSGIYQTGSGLHNKTASLRSSKPPTLWKNSRAH